MLGCTTRITGRCCWVFWPLQRQVFCPKYGYLTSGKELVAMTRDLCSDGYHKIKESFYTRVWVNTIFIYYINTREIFPKYEASCAVHRPQWYWKKNKNKSSHTLSTFQKNVKIALIIYTQDVSQKCTQHLYNMNVLFESYIMFLFIYSLQQMYE